MRYNHWFWNSWLEGAALDFSSWLWRKQYGGDQW
jgi:hypothetical protein